MPTYRVGVVGFGVGGATAAYLLARDGHHVTLLERAERVGPVGAGVLLQSSGQAILKHLGVLDRVVASSAPIDELYARHAGGRTLIRTRYGDLAPGCRAYGIHRGVLFNALHDLVRTQPVDVRLGCEVVARTGAPGDVRLTDLAGQEHGPFDFAIAADGARSRMRDACGIRYRSGLYVYGTLWVIAPVAKADPHLLQVVRGNRQLYGLLPLGDGLATLYWGLPLRDVDRVKAAGIDALKAEIRAFEPTSAEVLEFLHDVEQLIATGYRWVSMPRWSDATTLFIGDAAHAMSPHLGQGINLAMVNAWRFAARLREAKTPAEAFAAFERCQRPTVRYYAWLSRFLAPFFQSDWRVLGWGRDVALPLLPWVPLVKRQMLLTVSGQKAGLLGGCAVF